MRRESDQERREATSTPQAKDLSHLPEAGPRGGGPSGLRSQRRCSPAGDMLQGRRGVGRRQAAASPKPRPSTPTAASPRAAPAETRQQEGLRPPFVGEHPPPMRRRERMRNEPKVKHAKKPGQTPRQIFIHSSPGA